MSIWKELKTLVKKGRPNYQIIGRTQNGDTIYLIRKRRALGWDWIYDITRVGYDNRIVEYEAWYRTVEEARERIKRDIELDEADKIVTNTVEDWFSVDYANKSVGTY